MEAPKTLIFVPTYNERENAGELFKQILALKIDAEVLFLDDNSPDGTGQLLDELAAEHKCLHVIHRSEKLGIGGAHIDGLRWAYEHGYTRVLTMDCDFTHSPADIPRLLEAADGCDVVVGSRWLRSDSLRGWNYYRRLITNTGHFLTGLLLRMPYDATGAFRVYNLSTVPLHLFNRVASRGYAFFFESLFLLVHNHFKVREVSIVLPTRAYGNSKMSLFEAYLSLQRVIRLYLARLLNEEQFCVPEPFTQLNPYLVDPQHWDEYWDKKKHTTSVVYDIIATIYRNLIIKRQLNRYIRKTFPKGSKLVHAGCGSAQVDRDIQYQMSITEVDISASALSLCRKYNPRAALIQQADIMNLPFADGTFDGAYNLGVMEHFTDEEFGKIVKELGRVTKPDGKLVVLWPHAWATSVMVLNFVHWVFNSVLRQNVRLHPAEISLMKSRRWAEERFGKYGFRVCEYHFGPSDFFVQAVIVAEKIDEGRK